MSYKILRILHECSYFIEFIKRVEKNRKNKRLAEQFIAFSQRVNEFNYTGARMLDSLMI